jgi:DNA (cytosine-5)-methyltransferase 1
VSLCLNAGGMGRQDSESETLIAHALRAEGFDASEDGTGRGTPIVAHAFDARQSDVIQYGDKTGPLDTDGHSIAIAFSAKDHGADAGDIAPTLRAGGYDKSHANGGVMPAVVIPFDTTQITHPENRSMPSDGAPCHPLAAAAHAPAIVFESRYARNGRGAPDTIVPPLKAQSGQSGKGDAAPLVAFPILEVGKRTGTSTTDPRAGLGVGGSDDPMFTLQRDAQHGVGVSSAVRRLTPRECERLQGFPDDYTLIPYRGKPAADGPRYKALGNSMAVNCMEWIGERIDAYERRTDDR